MGGGFESRCVGRVYGADGAVLHIYNILLYIYIYIYINKVLCY